MKTKSTKGERMPPGTPKQIRAKARAGVKRNKKVFALRTPAAILNDIHNGHPVTMAEALRAIEHLEAELEKKECARLKEILDALEKLRQPPLKQPEITEEQRQEFDELFRRRRPEFEPMQPIPQWPMHPVIIYPRMPEPWWSPFANPQITC